MSYRWHHPLQLRSNSALVAHNWPTYTCRASRQIPVSKNEVEFCISDGTSSWRRHHAVLRYFTCSEVHALAKLALMASIRDDTQEFSTVSWSFRAQETIKDTTLSGFLSAGWKGNSTFLQILLSTILQFLRCQPKNQSVIQSRQETSQKIQEQCILRVGSILSKSWWGLVS